ncbi:GIY-YIG nuclease family protein [Corynebacterium freneyi]|uniref:GIY-YIG nuclease family protein n=1 Tax=Corynebacterium freneyi TaxID=134034 RepID=UPI00254AEA15|nr:GIY-YIG nuclease family protein [Corynebacterium freneyi]MDK8768847.1 GIY-YIG nuclease family protein [Corynebacterium freneyi]
MPKSHKASAFPPVNPPAKETLPAPDVRDFRAQLEQSFKVKDEQGRAWADSQWGVYAFYDFDGEPIYVGQTNEKIRTRIRRHLTNQRTDAVAMRVLDVMEVAEVEIWPIWDLAGRSTRDKDACNYLNALEYSAYLKSIRESRFKAILNEKIPPISKPTDLPRSFRFSVVDRDSHPELVHPDVRIARRAETISRLSDVVRERGIVSDGLRRVLLIQAIRLTYLTAERLAYTEGRQPPPPTSIDSLALIGSVLQETGPSEADIEVSDAELAVMSKLTRES